MRKSNLIKGMTLLSAVSFVTIFLLYRVGKFDHYFSSTSLQTSTNGGAMSSNYIDTIPKIDSTQKIMLSSSKSIIIIDQKRYRFIDTLKTKKTRVLYFDPTKTKPTEVIMSSSKSGKIFSPIESPAIYVPVYIDSITYDTLLRKFKKRQ